MHDLASSDRATLTAETQQIFVRNSTGLRKEAGTFDVFVYNVNNQNIGLGVAFLFRAIAAYPGGNFPLSAILGSLLVVPLYFVYSRMSADMARSGGDYVWTSRIFGPRCADRRYGEQDPCPGEGETNDRTPLWIPCLPPSRTRTRQ